MNLDSGGGVGGDGGTMVGSAVGATDVSGWVEEAFQMLDKHKLDEAEKWFNNIVFQAMDKLGMEKHLVQSLDGLAQIYNKRGRASRSDANEWHRMYINACTLQHQALDHLEAALANSSTDEDTRRWLAEEKDRSALKLKTIEESLVRSFQERLVSEDGSEGTNTMWLTTIHKHYKDKSEEGRKLHREEQDDGSSVTSSDSGKCPAVKKIDFEKVHTAIKKIVHRVSSEMKQRPIHRSLSMQERLIIMSPVSETCTREILGQFEKALNESDSDSKKRTTSDSSDYYYSDDSQRALNHGAMMKQKMYSFSCQDISKTGLYDKKQEKRYSKDDFCTLRGSYRDVMPYGILRIFRGYKNAKKPEVVSRPPLYSLQVYEEISPLLEREKQPADSLTSVSENDDTVGADILSVQKLDFAYACTLCTLAAKLQKENKVNEAHEMYRFALDILQGASQNVNNKYLLTVGQVLKNIGIIRCRKGDLVGGSNFMEEAVRVFGSVKDKEVNLNIASVWCELGKSYMTKQSEDETLFDYVMTLVWNKIENEEQTVDNRDAYSEDMSDDEDADNDSENGDSYSVYTMEALTCFSQALSILRKLQKRRGINEQVTVLLVEVLSQLGDCNIITGDYDRSLVYFEEALHLLQSVTSVSMLTANAHILGMLGTASFLIGNHSKAISMYQTSYLLQQHLYSDVTTNFEVAFTITMLAISNHQERRYPKAVSWCIKAFDLYSTMYMEKIIFVESTKRWFIIETLYILGDSYNQVSFYEKALHYLKLAQGMVPQNAEEVDTKQLVKILKVTADVYSAMEDFDVALKFYNLALENASKLGDQKSATALQNQLLNSMAGIHVSTRQYSTAAHYLEQAFDHQKNVESNIKTDMLGILHQLGTTYTLAGDVDRSIDCYLECVEAYREMKGLAGAQLACTLGMLGTLHHVKACIQDDSMDMDELLMQAESYYGEAISLEQDQSICVQYANFLFHRAEYADALLVMLQLLHSTHRDMPELIYRGVVQAVLPEHLHQEVDDLDVDEVIIDTEVFARYLAILCYKNLNLKRDASDCLIDLLKRVESSGLALNHSIFAYCLMELDLYIEASDSFAFAAELRGTGLENDVFATNSWICLALQYYVCITSTIFHMCWYKYNTTRPKVPKKFKGEQEFRNYLFQLSKKCEQEKAYLAKMQEKKLMYQESSVIRRVPSPDKQSKSLHVRDSGYYDKTSPVEETSYEESWESTHRYSYEAAKRQRERQVEAYNTWESQETTETPAAILEVLRNRREQAESNFGRENTNLRDIGYNSNEHLVVGNDENSNETVETWEEVHKDIERSNAMLHSVINRKDLEKDLPKVDVGWQKEDNSVQEMLEEWETSETVETPAAILQMIMASQNQGQENEVQANTVNDNNQETSEEWVTYEEQTVETPLHISEHEKQTDEGWVTYEEVVETPASVLRNLQNTEQMAEQSTYGYQYDRHVEEQRNQTEEGWTTYEEVVETPASVLQSLNHSREQTIATSSYRNQYTRVPEVQPKQEDEGWTTYEEVVETPASVLQSLQQNNYGRYTSTSYSSHHNNQVEEHHKPSDEGWTTYEEVVETPPSVLQTLNQQQTYSTQGDRYASQSSVSRWGQTQSQPEPQEDEWHMIENSVESSLGVLQGLQNQRVQSPQDEWVVEEEVVETPAEVLQMLARQQGVSRAREEVPMQLSTPTPVEEYRTVESTIRNSTSSFGAMDYQQNVSNGNHVADHEDEISEEWTVTEEVVETPSAILEARRNNNSAPYENLRLNSRSDRYASSNHYPSQNQLDTHDSGWTSSYSSSDHRTVNNQINRTTGFNESPKKELASRDIYSIRGNAGSPVQKKEEGETWEEWQTEETVETPAVLLAFLASQNAGR